MAGTETLLPMIRSALGTQVPACCIMRRFMALFFVSFLLPAGGASARPVLHLSPPEVKELRRRIKTHRWAKAIFSRYVKQAQTWRAHPRPIPRGETGWYHNYFCPEHAVRLIYDPARPHEHRCPVDGTFHRGEKYDAYWIAITHTLNLQSLYALALLYAVTGNEKYARSGAKLLCDYAAFFPKTKLHGSWAGKGRIMGQSLDEAVMILRPLRAYELLWESGALSPSQKRFIEETWFRPTAELLRSQTRVIHNIHCWHNAAIGAIGFTLGDKELVNFALRNPRSGFFTQVHKGTTEEGLWFERSIGYHFYTLSALEHLVLAAQRNGVRVLAQAPKLRAMYKAPVALADPQLLLHATNDGGATRLTSQAHHYELAASWYPEEPAFKAVLAHAYRGGRQRDSLQALLYGPSEIPPEPAAIGAESRLFGSCGVAVLHATMAGAPAYLLLDFGEHGGGHGHPDKLNLIFVGLGRTLAPDLGTSGYGIPLNRSWYRQSASHNVVVVDGRSQRPASGRCLSFCGKGPVKWITARCDTAYRDVRWSRTVVMHGDTLFAVDRLTAHSEHTFDWIYHNYGREEPLSPPPGAYKVASLGRRNGYQHFSKVRSTTTDQPIRSLLKVGRAGSVLLLAAGSPGTEAFIARCPGNPATETLASVILRRRGSKALFAAALTLLAPGKSPSLTALKASERNGGVSLQLGNGKRTCTYVVHADGKVSCENL